MDQAAISACHYGLAPAATFVVGATLRAFAAQWLSILFGSLFHALAPGRLPARGFLSAQFITSITVCIAGDTFSKVDVLLLHVPKRIGKLHYAAPLLNYDTA